MAAARAVARCECRRKIASAPFAFADVNERTDHRAHLMMQEGARHCGDIQFFAAAGDVEAFERFHRRFCLAFRGAERCEIVPADQPLRGAMHRFGIKRPPHAPAGRRRGECLKV